MTVACIIRDLQHAVSEVGGQDAVPEYRRGHERLQPSLPSGAPRYPECYHIINTTYWAGATASLAP